MKRTVQPFQIESLVQNLRFYILASSFLVSLIVLAWLRVEIPADQLYVIRLEQTYGLISTLFLYSALLISPLLLLIPKVEARRQLKFSRRAIGVSAACFALLHSAIALWGQLGGFDKLSFLPQKLLWAFAIGGVVLAILAAMAITSFDTVIRLMTFRRWKWLQRFGYLAALLLIIHVWLIGTHVSYVWIQWTAVGALSLLFGLESFRFAKTLRDHYRLSKAIAVVIFCAVWMTSVGAVALIPRYLKSYHSDQHSGTGQIHGGANHE